MVDAERLRETLDRLRTHIAAGVFSTATAETLVFNRRAIADSLKAILAKLDAVDVSAMSALSSVVREYRPEAQAVALRQFFEELQSGLRQHARGILGAEKIDLVVRLLDSPAPDLLRILGREDDENSHSDLIAWLLNPRKAPVVAPSALAHLVGRFGDADLWREKLALAIRRDSLSVRREFLIARELAGEADLARVDVVVTGPGIVLAIENKVWAHEHSEQTRAYAKWLESVRDLKGGLFLSPSGLLTAAGGFAPVSYLELVSALLDGPVTTPISASEEIVLGSYLKTLARGIIPVEMRAVRELGRKK
jgi:hypothetical protein